MSKIRLTESQLHRVIKESVNKILKENFNNVTWIIVDKATDGIVESPLTFMILYSLYKCHC